MKSLMGTKRLIKLALRRDRIKLPVWIILIVGFIASTLPTYASTYNSDEARHLYASSTATSMITRLLGGAITGPSLGEITIVETFLFMAILIALMNIFLVIRHTRQNEELGRSEIIGSMNVGRQAGLTAVLLIALSVNIIITGGLFVALSSAGLPFSGSLAYALVLGLIGILFASIAAVTAQLSEDARGASGLAGLSLGGAALIRGLGDALGSVNPDGLSVTTNWLSWLSPLGWGTNLQPFAAERWWVVALFAGLSISFISLAYYLLQKRDMGAGLIPAKPGRVHAKAMLLKPLGLQWRLHKTAFLAWGISIVSMGIVIGAVTNEFTDLVNENEQFRQLLEAMGGSGSAAELMLASTYAVMSLAAAAFMLQMLLRMHREENEGRVELSLSGRLSRSDWMLRYIVFAGAGAILIFLSSGIAGGLTYGLISGDALAYTFEMLGATVVYIPALLSVAAICSLSFALLPRYSQVLSWACLGFCIFIGQFGTLLKLPGFIINLSPFSHIPTLPVEQVAWMPLFILSIIGIVGLFISIQLFGNRDVTTE